MARRADDLVHLAEDVQPCVTCLVEGFAHDFLRDALDLDIHLQRGNAIICSGHLEVHVAEVIFITKDIGKNGEIVAFLDQSHGNACHRRLDRDTGIHQREAGAANRRH